MKTVSAATGRWPEILSILTYPGNGKKSLQGGMHHMLPEGKVQNRRQGRQRNIYLHLQLRGWMEAT